MSTCCRCTDKATMVVFAGEGYRFEVCDQHLAAEARLQIDAKRFRRRNARQMVDVWKLK